MKKRKIDSNKNNNLNKNILQFLNQSQSLIYNQLDIQEDVRIYI